MEDLFECKIKKPHGEDIYGEDDIDFMELVPEPQEAKLYELTTKISKARERKNYLTHQILNI